MATTEQKYYRLRNDDGSETGASWIAARDTSASILVDTNFRIRYALENTHFQEFEGQPLPMPGYWIYSLLNGSGNQRVHNSSTRLRTVLSTWFADGAACTQQISSPDAYKALNAGMSEDPSQELISRYRQLTNESEWCVQIQGVDVSDGDVITVSMFRGSSGQPFSLENYRVTATFTVNKPSIDFQALSDGISVGDSILNNVSTELTDGIAIGDSVLNNVFTKLIDGVSIGDSILGNPFVPLSDGIGVGDSLVGIPIVVMSDNLDIGDSISVPLVVLPISDGISIDDAPIFNVIMQTLQDGISIGDVLQTISLLFVQLSDGIDIGDQVASKVISRLFDAISIGDQLNMNVAIVLTDGINIGDRLIFKIAGNVVKSHSYIIASKGIVRTIEIDPYEEEQ